MIYYINQFFIMLNVLFQQFDYCVNNVPDKTIQTIELFISVNIIKFIILNFFSD